MQAKDFIENVKSGSIDLVEHTHKILDDAKKIDKEYNYFNVISEELALVQAKELAAKIKHKDKSVKGMKLLGAAVSVKDAICVKGIESTAGSRILKGYYPLFDAFVVKKVKEAGGIIIGKTSQDEFGFGAFSVNSGFKIPKNPFDAKRSCGGSSGGAAGIAQMLDNHIALGESTGGSIAEPSSFCGVYGLCPTYGLVSRNGLIDFGNSLDKIGPIGRTAKDAGLLLDVIAGHDSEESTSLNAKKEHYEIESCRGMEVGIIKEAFTSDVDENVAKNVARGIDKMREFGIEAKEVSMEIPIKYGIATYYMIATSEASTNLAKLCGIRYGAMEKLEGNFNEYFTKVRSENFGSEAKRRIILGTFARMAGYRDAFYIKAAKVRTLMISEYKKAFKKFDALVSPTAPMLPPKFSEIEKLTPLQHYLADAMTVSPNVAGLPHLNVPVGFVGGLPVGMLLTGDHLQEKKLLALGHIMEQK